MKVRQTFYVGLSDTNLKQELTNTSLLRFLEDIAGIHSEKVGYGASSIDKTKRTWILLSWKVKVLKRAKMNDEVIVETWSRVLEKFYAYRDFKVFDKDGNVIAIATSKWIYMDIENGRIVKVTDEVAAVYESEPVSVFEEYEDPKAKDLEKEPENEIDFNITRNLIDINNEVSTESIVTNEGDELLEEAMKIVVEYQQASTSFIQRKLRVGFNRASRIMDELEERGVISEKDGSKPRQVLIEKEDMYDSQ